MIPTSSSDAVIPHLEHVSPPKSRRKKRKRRAKRAAASTLDVPLPDMLLPGTFAYLPTDVRNMIYAVLFDDAPRKFFVIAAPGPLRQFQLRAGSDERQHDALAALRACDHTNEQLRIEARTYFYALRYFCVWAFGHEYLPFFVRWLEAIGPECRSALRSVNFAGSMWYQPIASLTIQLHALLRSCLSLENLTVEINIRHLFESCLPDLDAYLVDTESNQQGRPLNQDGVEALIDTVIQMKALKNFRMYLVHGVNPEGTWCGDDMEYRDFSTKKGNALAKGIRRKLRKRLLAVSPQNEAIVEVRYAGRHEQRYRGLPW
jgi:hypothetical protein